MQKEKNNILSYAMQAGFGLGGFWFFKYLFVIGATQYSALEYVNSFLIFFTPLLLLFYLIRFKNVSPDNKLKYWTGVRLGILLFFFAAIIEAAIVIVHVVWLDPSYISVVNEQTIELAKSLNFSESMMDELKKQSSFSPTTYVFRQMMSNVAIGLVLSLMLTPLASRINIDIKNLNK
jgi:hypothetical protein